MLPLTINRKSYCGVHRALVRPGRRALRRSLRAFGCLGGFWLARRPVSDCTFPVRGPLYSGLASVEPVPSHLTLHGFPYS